MATTAITNTMMIAKAISFVNMYAKISIVKNIL